MILIISMVIRENVGLECKTARSCSMDKWRNGKNYRLSVTVLSVYERL